MEQIRAIWKDGLGVVTLHAFQNTIPVEAYTREACMILALGEINYITNNRIHREVIVKLCDFDFFVLITV